MSNEHAVVDVAEKAFTPTIDACLARRKFGCNRHPETARIGRSVDDVGSKSQRGTVARQLFTAVVGTGPEELCLILVQFKMTG